MNLIDNNLKKDWIAPVLLTLEEKETMAGVGGPTTDGGTNPSSSLVS